MRPANLDGERRSGNFHQPVLLGRRWFAEPGMAGGRNGSWRRHGLFTKRSQMPARISTRFNTTTTRADSIARRTSTTQVIFGGISGSPTATPTATSTATATSSATATATSSATSTPTATATATVTATATLTSTATPTATATGATSTATSTATVTVTITATATSTATPTATPTVTPSPTGTATPGCAPSFLYLSTNPDGTLPFGVAAEGHPVTRRLSWSRITRRLGCLIFQPVITGADAKDFIGDWWKLQ